MCSPRPLLPLLACLLLAGCGGEAPPPPAAASSDLLLDLRARLDGDTEILGDGWVRAVQETSLLLWTEASVDARAARRLHHNLALIAGDVGVQLAALGPAGREGLERTDPTSLSIHDGFRAALGQGTDAYRAWVVGEGRALLEQRMEVLQAR